MQTPVALIIFNRPETTKRVFAEIAKAKPPKLFIIADGPRADTPGDLIKCSAARAIIEKVDWNCDLLTNFSERNLGCGERPASGITWVFENVDRCIILEDDCLPHPTFFPFCEELLEKYKDDKKLMQICGTDLQLNDDKAFYSYYFSSQNICFGGWATWRRAWKHFDIKLKKWQSLRDTPWLKDILENPLVVEHWQNIFEDTYKHAGNTDYWDYQWRFAFWVENGIAIKPYQHLISNIGFGPAGTHTKAKNHELANLKRTEMTFPLRHPQTVEIDKVVDQLAIDRSFRNEKKKLKKYFYMRNASVVRRVARKLFSHLFTSRK